jgi:hypothetical protein
MNKHIDLKIKMDEDGCLIFVWNKGGDWDLEDYDFIVRHFPTDLRELINE